MNKTFNYGSNANILIRTRFPQKIGEKDLKYEYEPYTYIKNIDTEMQYNIIETNQRIGVKNTYNYNESEINNVILNNVPITEDIMNLIFLKKETQGYKTVFSTLTTDENGELFLPVSATNIFIQNNSEETIYYNELPDEILLTPNTKYNITYQVFNNTNNYKQFSFNSKHYGYFTLDIETIGNEKNITNKMSLHFDRCALLELRNLNFNNEKVNTVDLIFTVITDENNNFNI